MRVVATAGERGGGYTGEEGRGMTARGGEDTEVRRVGITAEGGGGVESTMGPGR